MYFSGYGTKDFNKALKGTNIAAIQKGIDVQKAQLAKSKKPKDIERNKAQLAAAEARMAEVLAMQAPPAVSPAPTVPAIVTPPPPVAAPPPVALPSPMLPGAPPPPSFAPPPASETVAPPIMSPPSMFGPAPSAVPDSAPPAAPAPASKMPLILGAAGLGVLALLFLGKKKRG